MSKEARMVLTSMIGQTITDVHFGEMNGDNDAIIIETQTGALYFIESGSLRGLGILSLDEIDRIPVGFKHTK